MNKLVKLLKILKKRRYRSTLLKYGVAAGVEHEDCMRHLDFLTVIDVGANRGQFSTMIRECLPAARVIAFEPLKVAADKFETIYSQDPSITLHRAALGAESAQLLIHVSGRDDSSSLLPITQMQNQLFPGTFEVATETVQVAPLSHFLKDGDIRRPALLKIDVQGYELPVLEGCESLLDQIDCIYVECSFLELYQGQALARDVVSWLQARGFGLSGVYNPSFDPAGRAIQSDLQFSPAPR